MTYECINQNLKTEPKNRLIRKGLFKVLCQVSVVHDGWSYGNELCVYEHMETNATLQ